jgi:hypothetical protein
VAARMADRYFVAAGLVLPLQALPTALVQ